MKMYSELRNYVLKAGLVFAAAALPAPLVISQEGALALEEIVVTASRREEGIQDTALSIQAMSGSVMDQLGWSSFEDYLPSVSGVGFTRTGSGTSKIALRGVSNVTGSEFGITDSVSTVGLYLNDIPIQGSGSLPDLSLYDLSRVEVLKGPQGTLYGEGAMGGAIKMVTNSPDPEAFAGSAELTLSETEKGGSNYTLRGMVNIPLSDSWAMRVVGSNHDRSGFIDNIAKGIKDINEETHSHARISLAGDITDRLSAELLFLYDELEQDELGEFDPTLGDLKVATGDSRFNINESSLYGFTLKYQFENFDFISASSLYINERSFAQRFPISVGSILPLFGLPAIPTNDEVLETNTEQESFAQEFRLVSTGEGNLSWVVGVFYRDRENEYCGSGVYGNSQQINDLFNAVGLGVFAFPDGPVVCTPSGEPLVLERYGEETFEQISLYGEFTYRFSDVLSATIGLRWYDEEYTNFDTNIGGGLVGTFFNPNPTINDGESGEDGVIPKFIVSYQPNEDMLFYATAAQGFRAPGYNLNAGFGAPPSYESDSTWNYELGAKTSWLDNRLILNGSLYFNDWSDIQAFDSFTIQLLPPPQPASIISYIDNAGDGEVVGAELSLTALLAEGWEFGFNAAYNDSELVSANPGVGAVQGAQLPLTPELTFSSYLQYSAPVGEWGEGYFRVDYRYVDEQLDSLLTASSRSLFGDNLILDDYDLLNLRVGISNERWGAYLFVNNATDERPELDFVQDTRTIPGTIGTGRPRTYGVTINFALN